VFLSPQALFWAALHCVATVAATPHLPTGTPFEPNRGQWPSHVLFQGQFTGVDVQITTEGAVIQRDLVMTLKGSRPNAPVEGLDVLPGRSSYYPRQGENFSGIPHFGRVRRSAVYPGIDLDFHGGLHTVGGNKQRLEYDFLVASGADPSQIAVRFRGAMPKLNAAGQLEFHLPSGTIVQDRPLAYQLGLHGERDAVAAAFVLEGDEVRFRLGAYDRTRPLVIDPTVIFASYSGQVSTAGGIRISDARALNGSVYWCGNTDGQVTVVQHAPDGAINRVAFGALGNGSSCLMAIDTVNNRVAVGSSTTQTNFPRLNPAQASFGGGSDFVLALLNPAGLTPVSVGTIGGPGSEFTSEAAAAGGRVYLTSGDGLLMAHSLTLPSTHTVTTRQIGGTTMLGSKSVFGLGTNGSMVCAGGSTSALDLPLVSAVQSARLGDVDAFITCYDASLTTITFSSYVAGIAGKEGRIFDLAVDPTGGIVFLGATTGATGLPLTPNAALTTGSGGSQFSMLGRIDGGTLNYLSYHPELIQEIDSLNAQRFIVTFPLTIVDFPTPSTRPTLTPLADLPGAFRAYWVDSDTLVASGPAAAGLPIASNGPGVYPNFTGTGEGFVGVLCLSCVPGGFILNVSRNGSAGNVSARDAATNADLGMACPFVNCTTYQPQYRVVELTATAPQTHSFTGWFGCPQSVSPNKCLVSMSQARDVTAYFLETPTRVNIQFGGAGGGIVSAGGVDCTAPCSLALPGPLSLSAVADIVSRFSNWSNTCPTPVSNQCEGPLGFQGTVGAFFAPAMTLARQGALSGPLNARVWPIRLTALSNFLFQQSVSLAPVGIRHFSGPVCAPQLINASSPNLGDFYPGYSDTVNVTVDASGCAASSVLELSMRVSSNAPFHNPPAAVRTLRLTR
jgi:hypothetical protein